MSTPDWLKRDMVERALRECLDSPIKVSRIAMSPFVDSVGNYSSNLSRVRAETNEGRKDLVVKTLPCDESARALMNEGRMFRREVFMYNTVIPGMLSVVAGQTFADGSPVLPSPFAPAHIFSGKRPFKYILLEDLTAKGFRVCDRRLGLDLVHSLLSLRTLAVFHAASAAYLIDHRDAVKRLDNPYKLMNNYYEMTIQETFPLVANKFRQWEESHPFADALEALIPNAAEVLSESHSHEGPRFNVICHGEFWINNLMFKYDGYVVKEVCFVDFQMSHVTSPAADLLYFLTSSVNKEVYVSWWSVLIKEYFETLSSTLLVLQLPPPPLEMIQEALQENCIIAVHTGIVITPLVKAPIAPEDEKALSKGYNANNLYDTEDVKNWLQMLLRDQARKGYIAVPGLTPSLT